MYDDITAHISSCHDYQTNKVPNQAPAGKLQPSEIPVASWDVVTTDFLTELPISAKGFDVALVIVDKLSKRAIFEALKKTTTAQDVSQIFQDRLFSNHGFPASIVSDRDPKFVSHHWACLTELLNITLNTSTPTIRKQTGSDCRLSENSIKTLSSMLRSSIQQDPTNWDTALSQFKYEYNASKHASTGLSPFEVNIGRIPHEPFTRSLSQCKIQCQSSVDFVERRKAFARIARDNLTSARAKQKHYADMKRRDVTYNVGDWVMLCTKDLNIVKRADLRRKWQPKYLGPFEVKEFLGPVTYEIEMPPTMKRANNVYHVSKLKPYQKRPQDKGPVSVVIDTDGNVEQILSAILDKKRENRRVFYVVQFEGDMEADAIWMPKSELKHCNDLVRAFEQKKQGLGSTRALNLEKKR